MRIAHVLRRISFDDWGGTEQVVWNLAKAQLKAGHEVRIFATDALCKVPHETRDGLEIFRFPALYPWWPMTRRLIAELDRKGGNPFVPRLGSALREWSPEVVHCHAMARMAELCMREASRIGAKCVVSLHGGGENVPTAEAKSLRSPTRMLFPWGKILDYAFGWVRRVPEDADGIVCVGEDEYERYKARHPHVLFLPNGVDAAAYGRPAENTSYEVGRQLVRGRTPARTRSGESSYDPGKKLPGGDSATAHQSLNMLCVARIDRQKNQMMLVEALARLPGARLRCVGPVTQPDYLDELKRKADELGVADRVTFTGAFKPGGEELLAEYRSADVFVLPSRHEPFGIVVLEAWAAGLPVVASNVGGLGRLCAAHKSAALVFEPSDDAALDSALRLVSNSPEMRSAMSEAGRAAAKEYDWQVLGARLVDFYGSFW